MANSRILIVDDKSDVRLSLRFLLSNHGYHVIEAESLADAKACLGDSEIDLLFLDMNFQLDTTSGEEGLGFIKACVSADDCPPIIAMTAWSSVDLVVKAMQYGAVDFFAKPWDNSHILDLVQKHLRLHAFDKTIDDRSNTHSETPQQYQEFLWMGQAMCALQRKLQRVAKTDATVLLRGANGTGKTSIAKYLHDNAGLSGDFISVNVAAIPDNLFESELFGHKKGAFTDASADRTGRIEAAQNGTLFLDEIGSLPLGLQAKLLRVLESNEYERVGDNVTKYANCRIICASNADFDALMANGEFRTDLYFRINPIELEVPALVDRKDEILPLVNYFLAYHSKKFGAAVPGVTQAAKDALVAYHWPGNVRELSNLMARSVLLCDDQALTPSDFSFKAAHAPNASVMPMITLEQAEKKLLAMAMKQTSNNVEEAALLLGISKSAIYRRLEKFKDKH